MRVLYDGMIYALQPAGGISRYFARIIDGLPENVQPILNVVTRRELNYPRNPRLKVDFFPRFRPGRFSYPFEKLYFRTRNRQVDIFHPTYYDFLRGDGGLTRPRAKVVITVYDMMHEHFPAMIDQGGGMAARKRWVLDSADAILCISENTKKDLLFFHPHLEKKPIFVTPLASSLGLPQSEGPEPIPPQPYLLYVGSRVAYKNFPALARAFAKVAPDHPELLLCTAGGGTHTAEETRLFAELGIVDRVCQYPYLDDPQLVRLYRHATYFVYSSLYEGFGLPPLEAMACGAPVIVASSSSLPEVVGDAGMYFDPANPADLTTVLTAALVRLDQREEMIARGFRRAAFFHWENTTRETVRAYEHVLGK